MSVRDVAIGLVLGMAIGGAVATVAAWSARAPDPGVATSLPAPRPTSPGPTKPRGPDDDCRARVAALEAQLEAAGLLNRSLQDEAFGPLQPWPSDVDPKYRDQFEGNVRAALAECDVPADLISVDCGEPPCLAAFRGRDPSWRSKLVNQCPAWSSLYGSSTTDVGGVAECGDGRTESVSLLGPSMDLPTDPSDPWAGIKWAQARQQPVIDAWTCLAAE